MITRRELLATGGAVLGSMLWPGAVRASGVQVLTAADVHVDQYPTVEAVRFMSRYIEERSGGELSIRMYHAGQLGRESDTINLARFGALDITRVTTAALNNLFPATQALSLPYLFDSVAHMRRALDGAPGRQVLKSFEQRGLIGLAFYDAGSRCLYNARHPVRTPAELAGLKVRVPLSDIFMDLLQALGANPTPLAFGEVFSALQTGLIDGAENNWQTYYTTRQFEVAHDWSQSEHAYTPDTLMMSAQRFEALPVSHQEVLRAAADASVPHMRQLWDERQEAARSAVLAAGTRIAEVDRAAFQKASQPVLEKYLRDPVLDRLHQDIRALA